MNRVAELKKGDARNELDELYGAMAQGGEVCYLNETVHKYSKPHEFFKYENGGLTFQCFCKQPMKEKYKEMVCAQNNCGFKFSEECMRFMLRERLFKSNSIQFPFCTECNVCNVYCQPNIKYQSYGKLAIKCDCKAEGKSKWFYEVANDAKLADYFAFDRIHTLVSSRPTQSGDKKFGNAGSKKTPPESEGSMMSTLLASGLVKKGYKAPDTE